jgi:hypothetical protein
VIQPLSESEFYEDEQSSSTVAPAEQAAEDDEDPLLRELRLVEAATLPTAADNGIDDFFKRDDTLVLPTDNNHAEVEMVLDDDEERDGDADEKDAALDDPIEQIADLSDNDDADDDLDEAHAAFLKQLEASEINSLAIETMPSDELQPRTLVIACLDAEGYTIRTRVVRVVVKPQTTYAKLVLSVQRVLGVDSTLASAHGVLLAVTNAAAREQVLAALDTVASLPPHATDMQLCETFKSTFRYVWGPLALVGTDLPSVSAFLVLL